MGADSPRARVVKLFNGFRPAIRKALLREHMNPEYTSWKGMVREAEYQEMAENVNVRDSSGKNHNHRSNGQACHNENHQGTPDSTSKTGKESHNHDKSKNHRSTGGRKGNKKGTGGSKQGNHPNKTGKEPAGPSLSKEEKEELRAANKCFVCGEEGHFARNCRHKGKAKSGNGKPPGVSAFRMRMDLDEVEQRRLASLGETTELTIGMIGWPPNTVEAEKEYNSDGDTIPDLQSVMDSDLDDETYSQELDGSDTDNSYDNEFSEVSVYPDDILLAPPMAFRSPYQFPVQNAEERLLLLDVDSQRAWLGDALCNKLEEVLESLQPYPGDPANVLTFCGRRFMAVTTSHNEILVHNWVFDEFEVINRSVVRSPTYALGDWYAQLCYKRTLAPYNHWAFYQTCLVVEPLGWNAQRALENGAPYPWDETDRTHKYQRFEVIGDEDDYLIYDRHLGF